MYNYSNMLLLKKLLFAPFFVIIFMILLSQISSLLTSYDFIFSLSVNGFILLIILSFFIIFSSFLFVLFATFANDLKFVLPLGIFVSILALIFLTPALGIVFMVGLLVSLALIFVSLQNTLKNYINFSPTILFSPHIKHLSSFLILIISITFFLSATKIIQQDGFELPDSLIDASLKFANPLESPGQESLPPQLQIPPEQIEMLRQNPDLLRQSGLDPNILDNLDNSVSQTVGNLSNDLIKQTVKDQIQGIIKPYLSIIPAILAVLLFLTLQSLASIINLLTYPLLWITFYILEKTGFIKFTTEMRPVKKMVI